MITYFFDGKKKVEDFKRGKRLNNFSEKPYIKLRLEGRGGFRIYYLLLISNDKLYLLFVHPKTGSEGSENITKESQGLLYKKAVDAITNSNLYLVNEKDNHLVFQKM